jgi:hypothetical protein
MVEDMAVDTAAAAAAVAVADIPTEEATTAMIEAAEVIVMVLMEAVTPTGTYS